MIYATVIRPAAHADLQAAYDWYEKKRQGLGSEFLDCVDETLERIRQWPDIGFTIYKSLRRARVRRFPYGVFYLIEGQAIVVVGVFHGRQAPRRWKSRLP